MTIFSTCPISLGLMILSGISVTAANAQSLASAPQPSPELKSLAADVPSLYRDILRYPEVCL